MAANLAEIIRKAEALKAQEPQETPEYSQFNAGLRGSVATMGAQGNAALASGARALGADRFAAGRDQAVQQDMAEAQEAEQTANAPTWDQAKGLRGTLDWAKYQAGALTPALAGGVGAGVVGGMVGGIPGAVAAPTALFAPINAGDIALREEQDPAVQGLSPQEKFVRAAGGGILSSAVENALPGALGGRIVGKGFGASMGKHLLLGPLEQGAAMAGGEALKQTAANPKAPLNTEAIKEAGIGGAALGGVLGAGHAGINALHGAPGRLAQGAKDMAGNAFKTGQDAINAVEPPQGAKDAWSGVVDLAGSAYKGAAESALGKTIVERTAAARKLAEDIMADPQVPEEWKQNLRAGAKNAGDKAYQGLVWAADQLRSAKTAVEESGAADAALAHLRNFKEAAGTGFQNIRDGVFGGDKEALSKATPEQAKRMLDEDQRSNVSKLHDWLEGFKDRAETPEARAQAEQMQAGLSDPATHAEAAKFADAQSFKDTLIGKVQAMAKGFDKATGGKGDAKKSEDFSGVESAIREHLIPAIKEDPRLYEALKSDPKIAQGLSSNIRKWIATAAREQNLPKGKDGRADNMEKFKLDIAQKRINDKLVSILGSKTGSILSRVYGAVKGKDPAEIERVFGHIKAIGDQVSDYRSVQDALVKLLPKNSERWADLNSLETAQILTDWANGKGENKTNERAVKDAEIHSMIQEVWGKNADKVYNVLESHVAKFQATPDKSVAKSGTSARELIKGEDEQDKVGQMERYDRDERIAQDSKNPDNSVREMYAGKGDTEGQDSVAKHEHGPGIAGLMEHPDVQRGKYKSGDSYTEAKIKAANTAHPNHEFKFFSMREHQKMTGRDASDIREQFPELRDVPETDWADYGYLRGTNRDSGKDVKYLGLDHNGKSHAKKPETVGSLLKSPASEKASGVPYAQSSTARAVKDFQNRYPGYNVSFVSLKDYMKSTSKSFDELRESHGHDDLFPESEAKAGEAGYLKIQGRDRDAEGIAPYEMRKIKLDSRAFSDSPSRLEIGGGLYDAVALTNTFMKKAGYDATSTTQGSDMHRIRDAFLSGYAALLDHHATMMDRGEELIRPSETRDPSKLLGNMDPDTVVAYRTGRKITVEDISRDLGSRIKEDKLTPEQTKLAEHFDEMARGQLQDLYRKAWTTEEAVKDALHAAAVDHLEGSKMAPGDFKKALAEYKKAHRDDAEYRLSDREGWSNALYNALHKDQGFRDEVLGNAGTTEPRPGDMVDRTSARAEKDDVAQSGVGEKLPRSGVDRAEAQGAQRTRIEALRSEIAKRERMIAGLQKRLEGETKRDAINRINARIEHFTEGRRSYPDDKGETHEHMPSLRDLKNQLAKHDAYDATTPNPAKLDSMMKHIKLKESELHFQLREIADLEKQQAAGKDVSAKLAEAHERLAPVKEELRKWGQRRADLAQERIHHSGDPYGPGGSGKREGDPHGDIHTTSALFSENDLTRLTDMDGQFRDARYGDDPNVYHHNKAIAETKGQIAKITARLSTIDSALSREKTRQGNMRTFDAGEDENTGPAVDVRALNAERIKLLAQKSKLQDRKNEFVAQTGKLTPEGVTNYGKALDARMASFEEGWRGSKMTATKEAMIKDIKARVEKMKGYADVLPPAIRDKLMRFAAPDGRIVNVAEANDHLTTLIKASSQLIREKDFKVKKAGEAPKPVEGSPDPKAVAAKKAAFLERAASGDDGLIKEISESKDVKGLQRALQALDGHEAVKVAEAINDRIQALRDADPGLDYQMLTKKYSLDRSGYETFKSEYPTSWSRAAFPKGKLGPLEEAQMSTQKDLDGNIELRVLDRTRKLGADPVLTLDLFKNSEGKWEIGVDGPQDGHDTFSSMGHLFDYIKVPDRYGNTGEEYNYSKYHDWVWSKEEMRKLFRTLRDQAAELGVDPDEITFGRDTSVTAGKPYVILNREQIKRFSEMSAERVDPDAQGPSRTTHQELLDQLHKTLGNTVALARTDIMHAGEFSRTELGDLINLSVHSLNPMGTLHHESLHAFFQQLRDKGLPEISNVVEKMANSPMVMKQLRERLAHSPEALKQLRDPEERAAYAYQFWSLDKTFKLVGEPKGVFEKVKAFFQKLMGIWTNDERAEHILKYFNSGEYAKNMHSHHAVHDALMNVGKNHAMETMKHIGKPLMELNDALLGSGGERLRDSGIPSLERLADRVKAKLTDSMADAGYIPAARVARGDWINKLDGYLKDYTHAEIQEAWEARIRGEKPVGTKAKLANLMLTKFYKEIREDYLIPAGVKVGDLGPEYAHRVYDSYYISTHQEEFKALLDKYGVNDRVMHSILANEGNGFGNETGLKTPGFDFNKARVIHEIPHAELAPFLQKDFYNSINKYITQATKRGEWAKRFKDDGSGLRAIMAKAKEEGATKAQLQMAEDYVQGVNGTLGDTISPDARRLMGNMMVYQNIRLLPMMLFSSMVDPLGIAVRGGTAKDAFAAFKRGARELHKAWQSDPTYDGATEMARTMGIIENANLNHSMSSMFGGGITNDTAGHINDTFFKLNFAEQVNQSMRVSAMEAAKRFIVRHADHPTGHSARWLAELGLTKADVKKDAQGELLMDPNDTKIKMALNRWVDGAVLRPDAADKPIWMNDPHFALVGHLKQFAFAFQHTIIDRVMHEMSHGNYRPALAAASYIPVMFAADAAKSIVTSGQVEPDWKKNWTLMDHVGYETQRAGLLGVSQFSADAMNDIREGGTGVGRLLGPTIEQLSDVAMVAGGRKQFEPVALHAMPANALYANWADANDHVREAQAD